MTGIAFVIEGQPILDEGITGNHYLKPQNN